MKKGKKLDKLLPFVRSYPQHLRRKRYQLNPKKITALSKSAFATNTAIL
jgi:hypothetical protein